MTVLRSERLTLSPIEPGDAAELLTFFNDADVGRWLLDGEPVSADWVDAEIESSRSRFDDGSAGLWGVRTAAAGAHGLVGVVGFRPFFDPPELQLIYALSPSQWGRGYATEAARAAIAHAFETMGLDEVRAATDEPNVDSIVVLRRLGMERWKVIDGEPHATWFYRLGKAEWTGRSP